ncbi:MAG: phosphoribosylaminoimidazole carboxylase, ATPase subunit [Verrucomicrobiales bacterium]|nr:phosphoribosylaminoimidazole carboxylase, ATPase subunit [Verrucomicrobiales bacterium]
MKSQSSDQSILPGAVIGVLGGGQLGRMFALEARAMGYKIHVYSPEMDAPAGQIADIEVVGQYEDEEKLTHFVKGVAALTFEFENVSAVATSLAEKYVPVRPGGNVLHISQHRLREKTFLQSNGFPVTGFRSINSLAELEAAAAQLGIPAVLKTAGFGYDGKGQVKIKAISELPAAWKAMNGAESVYEAFVDFEKEVSVIAARNAKGDFAAYPVFENSHANHILDVTFCPAAIPSELAAEAVTITRGILERLEVVGLLTVEFFVTKSGKLLVNELAPRPHNSGHLTMDACVTSQFEQQLRAVCNLPLGDTSLLAPAAAMANLLGDVWAHGVPNWGAALEDPQVKLHLYGKAEPRAGRKMGHFNVAGHSIQEAVAKVSKARSLAAKL